ncbi:MAG: hypothetical protein MJ198_09565 [Bacteroidales bacterium]|nr:hypothetical protein [Bacteroidales bacterium]
MKKLKTYIPLILLSLVAIACLSFAEIERATLRCTDVVISIEKNPEHSDFVTEEDIYNIINSNRNMLIGLEIGEFDIAEIESTIEDNPTVLSCETYFTLKGELHINIKQRTPLLRVVSQNNRSFYIDENGYFMPLSEHASARVIVVTGEIYDQYQPGINIVDIQESKVLQDAYAMAKYIRKDEMLLPLIEQIYVNENQEFVLGSKIGPSTIEFGAFDNYEIKFRNLKAFYQAEKVRENWNLYKALSLKFRNQIVCTKK